ncbi:hypothetical protein ONS96_003826 [Cadophora gregata f. sp. sojae]|nr:hypothetical protein ONS96_003826 [Cadophora gregata f. sp. sojae]
MVPTPLMFRVVTASRQAQLRPPTTFLRSFHCTTSLRAAADPASNDTPTDTSPAKSADAADSTTSTPWIDQPFHEAIVDIVNHTKPKRTSTRKLKSAPPEDTKPKGTKTARQKPKLPQDGDATVPRKPGRPRKNAVAATVTISGPVPPAKPARSRRKAVDSPETVSETVSTAPALETPALPLQKTRTAGRPKIEPPAEPRSDIKTYLRWGLGGNWDGGKSIGDRKRMNIISEDACDAIITRMKPSLERHRGCDIIDINPGVGVWSAKLHDFLKPRTHILMEPDIRLCGPLLEPFVKAPDSTYKLIPKSGLVWGHLESVLNKSHLPFQTAYSRDDPRLDQRNDTLLVVANLGYYPKKPYKGFASLGQMVIYQLMSSINAHSLFQKYGQVRMLIWINDEERHNILPKTVSSRRKGSAEADFSCEKLEEVASGTATSPRRAREVGLDLEGLRKVLQKMEAKGIEIPKGRESFLLKQMFDLSDEEAQRGLRMEKEIAQEEYASLKKQALSGISVDRKRLSWLKYLTASNSRQQHRITALCNEFEKIMESAKAIQGLADPEQKDMRNAEYQERMVEWEENVAKLSGDNVNVVRNRCEDRLALRREKPLLLWDRREVEPLRLEPEEFYPAQTMCLFDIQPKALNPVLRKDYPNNYDVLEYLLVSFFTMPSQSVKHGLVGLVPGAYEWIDAECPSLKDVYKGGKPDLDRLSVRCLTEEMLVDMVEAWERWPFKPNKYEMLSRMGSVSHDATSGESDELGQAGTQ